MENTEDVEWIPNAELLTMLMDMGISKITAEHALYYTGNNSAEAAASYVFDNFESEETPCSPVKPSLNTTQIHSKGTVDASQGSDDELYTNYKMVFVVNSSLDMSVGKLAAQVAHACLGLYRDVLETPVMNKAIEGWIEDGEKKIVLKGNNHVHLLDIQSKCEAIRLPNYLVYDAGKTEIPPNSVTVLAVFGEESYVNAVTGDLSLLK